MCGIVAYFGGAGNSLTRLLTGMSAIIYRAPDSTGIGLFGDDREPIRLRKSIGSIVQLLDVLRTKAVYVHSEALCHHLLAPHADDQDRLRQQERLLAFEGFDPSDCVQTESLDFDALVDLEAEQPARLSPGHMGTAWFQDEYSIRSRKDLSRLISRLITGYDLSPLAIHTLIRSGLAETIGRRREGGAVSAAETDILIAFDDLFETTRAGQRVKRLRHRPPGHQPKPPNARKQLWQCLIDTVIRIPADYNREAVCCLFRLLDVALLSRIPEDPSINEALNRVLDTMWMPSGRPYQIDWRSLYAAEKGLNVYGWAGAAALAYLQREVYLPAASADAAHEALMENAAVVPGRTDPVLLRYLATPIIAHGRWAMQSAVTVRNAHPFMDARGHRALALNGQFDSRVEARLRKFLKSVGKYRLRSGNSAEYAALLWGHFFEQLRTEQRRSDLVRRQVAESMTDIAIGSQSIDYHVYHRVRKLKTADLDRLAFVTAARQIVKDGGQIAVAGISLVSPQHLYVASHNRPVFIVRRLENDDFMVVSDINAALGLFPQELVEETINALEVLKERQARSITRVKSEEIPRIRRQAITTDGFSPGTFMAGLEEERKRLLEQFAVEVHPLDGEELFARIETGIKNGTVRRKVTITNFEGYPVPDVEPFRTCLDPVPVRKDGERSFHETHLREIPERFRFLLNVYGPETPGGQPVLNLNNRVLSRSFGRHFERLRRVVLVGTGSAYHMAMIARQRLLELMPEMAVEAMRPGDFDTLRRRFMSQQTLFVMLSWSATTAEMVQLAQRLHSKEMLMVGISEKRFADMALTSAKSAGVMPVFSGEEVTIAGIKSTLCMLLCAELLGTWLYARKGRTSRLATVFNRLHNLEGRIGQLNDDEEVLAFSRETALSMAGADAVMVLSAAQAAGTGREIALKLEEAGWYAVCKWYAFEDILAADPGRWLKGRSVLLHATCRAHIDTAVAVLRKLKDAGIITAVVTCPNRHLEEINRLCGRRCLVLPCMDESTQPYIDIVFYYRLALDFSFACGHGPGAGPRNRAKSSTVSRSRPKALRSTATELKQLEVGESSLASAVHTDGWAAVSSWEKVSGESGPAEMFGELIRLTDILREDDSLAAMGVLNHQDVGELGRLLFGARSEINEVAFVSLDPAARAVVRDVAAFWRRLIDLPLRELPTGEWPGYISEDTLVLVVATAVDDRSVKVLPAAESPKVAWFGPEPPGWLGTGVTTAGRMILPVKSGRCAPARMYTGLNVLFTAAWTRHEPEKAAIVRRHMAGTADAVRSVLNDDALQTGLQEVFAANARYRTAFFISPFAGSGRAWETQFDDEGHLLVVHHPPGQLGYGPIVTIDGQVDEKFVPLEKRTEMIERYGETRVDRWESWYLAGSTCDGFLADPPSAPLLQPKTPFYAANHWYLPVLQPGYDTHRDNLIILDMTSERYLPQSLDELSLIGSRYPRLVVITQAEWIREIGEKTLFSFPVSDLLVLPPVGGAPIPDFHLPFVLNALGVALAEIWRGHPDSRFRNSPYKGGYLTG